MAKFASSWEEMDDILSVRRDFSAAFEDVRQAKPEDFKDVIRRYKKRNEDPAEGLGGEKNKWKMRVIRFEFDFR